MSQPPHELPPEAQAEFLRLFSQHSRRIYQFILTLTMNHADAEEVYQNTCVVLWKKFDKFDPDGFFYAWACRIAQLEFMQVRRHNQRLQLLSDEVLNLLADQVVNGAGQSGLRQDALSECLGKLKIGDRQLIRERYTDELAPKEIARKQSKSVHSVYRALARIHSGLRDCVQRSLAREQSR
jgi:RNA polymerase sigma-70 factor (ECF subfamily)